MNPAWQSWAAQQSVGTPRPDDTWFCSLHQFALIQVGGADAFSFLNNQLSSDVNKVSKQKSQFGVYCNPKGRVHACILISGHDDGYYLRTTAAIAEMLIKKLQMYILRSQVTLHISEAAGLGIGGTDSSTVVKSMFGQAPAEIGDVVCHHQATILRTLGDCPRYEIYAPMEELMTYWEQLNDQAVASQADTWRQYDIQTGIPNIYPETGEQFVPQMINIDILGGVSFSKGCYPGQEVVSRTHYLGKLKRRMYRFITDYADALPGTPIYVPAYSQDQPSGTVVDSCTDSNGKTHGLAVLRLQGLDSNEIYIGSERRHTLELQKLPYKVTAESIDPEKITSQSTPL